MVILKPYHVLNPCIMATPRDKCMDFHITEAEDILTIKCLVSMLINFNITLIKTNKRCVKKYESFVGEEPGNFYFHFIY